ncbi:MAG: peroxiredoxin [Deltaproteobacteria bacterium GWA2_45_12]|nr:MAG: peroxiredoxin [Deltaproteobacteria bacterium GWA2_45_12]
MLTFLLQTGSIAPDFTLPSQEGKNVSLSDFKGQNIVLYFYPKDDTPGCTKEACSFRDQYEVFRKKGAVVLGVSSDSVASHQKFSQKYKLPFLLLADSDGKVRKLYGVKSTMGIIPGRTTFVIDKKGVIKHVFSSQFQAQKHIEEALKALGE